MAKQLKRSKAVARAYKIKDLYYNRGLSMREIAERFGIKSSATVHQYVHAVKVRGVDVTDWEYKLEDKS